MRNSLFTLLYEARKLDYGRFAPSRDLEQMGGVAFQFNFGSGDTLLVTETYTKGITDVRAIDEGGEFEFQGAPFNLNRIEAVWSRTTPARQGFIIRVARVDLNFDSDEPVPFFDYRGFESTFEYRQPLANAKWLRVYYDSRRFNHYQANDPTTVGQPFRKEEADTLQVGLGGSLGGGTPFNLRLGYGKFRLAGSGAEFDGLVGSADASIRVAPRTSLSLVLWRRPLPSAFPTYYIVNLFQVGVERPFMREFMVGARLAYSYNKYGDEIVDSAGNPLPGCSAPVRKDHRGLVEGYFDWRIHPRFAIRVAAGRQRRVSNCASAEFEANAISTGIRLGWF